MQKINIRETEKKDWAKILEIVKKLRGWFDNVAFTLEIPNDLKFHQGLVAELENKVVGFITYSSFEGEVFISWLGVLPEYQRNGIGKKLVLTLEEKLKKMGIKKLKVETLSDKIEYEPYKLTRAFYQKMGYNETETKSFISKETKEKLEMVIFRKVIN